MTSRNTALAQFLKSRRTRLTPADVGLTLNSRRRVAGLRREEVALLADLGIAWYTWLEQGRPIRVSVEALDRISVALRLSPPEARYLRALVETGVDGSTPWIPAAPEHVGALIAAYDAGPAYILNPRWDVVAWNADYRQLYAALGIGPIAAHNMLALNFSNASMRDMIVNWPAAARRFVAMFRADYALYAGDQAFEELITSLLHASSEFAELWSQMEVDSPEQVVVNEVLHPVRGRRTYQIVTLAVPDAPGYSAVFHVPLGDER